MTSVTSKGEITSGQIYSCGGAIQSSFLVSFTYLNFLAQHLKDFIRIILLKCLSSRSVLHFHIRIISFKVVTFWKQETVIFGSQAKQGNYSYIYSSLHKRSPIFITFLNLPRLTRRYFIFAEVCPCAYKYFMPTTEGGTFYIVLVHIYNKTIWTTSSSSIKSTFG